MTFCISPFANPARHWEISWIVRRNSTNRTDVREAALSRLDLTAVRSVLDLGCGFGFMTEAVAPRCAPDAHLVGVDACPDNEAPFLRCVHRAGRTGRFLCRLIDDMLEWPGGTFDLVVASYSLYFFPRVIAEIARVLKRRGTFIAITHSEESIRDLVRLLGGREDHSYLLPLTRNFSSENGDRVLASWFSRVELVEYRNALVFEANDEEDLVAYLRFKLPFLHPDSEPVTEDERERLRRAVHRTLAREQKVVLAKNDTVFRCREPVAL